ncbi:TonB-dependent receptor [Hymenobacter koreensis]
MIFRLVAVLLLAGLWLGAVPFSAAQAPCTLPLAGRITDHESREGLAGATVVLLPSQEATQTDADGHFHFHVCSGTYRVQVSFIGYRPEEAELRVTGAAVRNFQLHPNAVTLRGAVVHGERVATPTPHAQTSLSGRELEQTRGQALGEALRRIVGVSALQTGPGIFKPVIHGLHSNRVAIINNGVRQEGQQWGQEHGPEIDPFVASQLTVVKGADGVRYGSDAMGGVVLVQPRPLPDTAGVNGEVHAVAASNNGLGALHATLEGNVRQLPALSWRVQGTVRQAGNARTPDYWLDNTGLREQNAAAAAGWRREQYGVEAFFSRFNARTGLLSTAIVGNPTDLRAAITRGRPLTDGRFSYQIDRPYQHVRHDLFKLTGFVKPGFGGRLTSTLAHQNDQRDEFDVVRATSDAARANRPQLSYQNGTTTAEVAWEHPHWGDFGGTFGVSGTYQRNRYAPRSRQFIPFYTNRVGGAFAVEHWQRGRVLLEAGLRVDIRDLRTERLTRAVVNDSLLRAVERRRFRLWTPAASVGMVYDVQPHFALRADAALVRRAPAANERYAQGLHSGIYEEGYDVDRSDGAPELRPETARNLSLTATLHDNARFNGELTLYQNTIDGYLYQVVSDTVQTIQGAFPRWRTQQSDAVLRGLDVSFSYQPTSRWLFTGKAALLRARNRQLNEYLVFMPADRFEAGMQHSWPDRANARLRQRFIGLSFAATRRQTRVPSATYDLQAAPDGYGLLGAELGGTLQLGRTPLTISITGTNLLNERYRDYLNRYRYFAEDLGRNVTLRLRAPLVFGRPVH